jgi:hypothetical protein
LVLLDMAYQYSGRVALFILIATVLQAQSPPASRLDKSTLSRNLDTLLKLHGENMDATIWLGGSSGSAWFELGSGKNRPTASAIKTFYLVELFDRYEGKLDNPLPGADAVLKDDSHQAISHFTPEQRDEIRRELRGASVRRIADVMMGKEDASNAVYNAAANLTTAALGGPEALTALIRKRDPAFAAVSARRYMLRNRSEPGDNEASATALAVLYQRLASRQMKGIDRNTIDAIHETFRRDNHRFWGRNFSKEGNLLTDPQTHVRAGWWQTPKGPMIYVVMTTQPVSEPSGRNPSAQQLSNTADSLMDALSTAGWAALQ